MKKTRNQRIQAAWKKFEAVVDNPAIVRPGEGEQLLTAAKKLVAAHQRAALPKGGNDEIQTPDDLAMAIVKHFKPTGVLDDPCQGEGAFYRAFERWATDRPEVEGYAGSDITDGHDFLAWAIDPEQPVQYDWIITNPPWSKFTAFLQQSMRFANNVVFLDKMNAWGFTGRLNKIHAAGFALVELARVKQPKNLGLPWAWP